MPPLVLSLIAASWLASMDDPAGGGSPARASIRWSTPRPFRVGQVVEGSVAVEGRSVAARPAIAGAIGSSTVDFTWIDPETPSDPIRVVFWKPGRVAIPPGRFEAGDTVVVATPRSNVEVVAVPSPGRPGSFLGGVGPFSASASADRASVELGETFRLTISIQGDAAVGSLRPPDNPGWAGVEVKRHPEPVSTMLRVADASAFRREYAYLLRPTRPGRLVLAPVAISAFDPVSNTYQTRYSPGVEVEVRPAPRVDPRSIRVARIDARTSSRATQAAALGSVALGLATIWWLQRWLRAATTRILLKFWARNDDPRQVARRCLRWLRDAAPDSRTAEDLAGWVDRWTSARSRQAISSVAAVDLSRLVAIGAIDEPDAASLGLLVEAADRVRFSGRSRPDDLDGLIRIARTTFEGLARRPLPIRKHPRLP